MVFPVNTETIEALPTKHGSGKIVAIGGGKDSLLSTEILRSEQDLSTWSLGHRQQLTPLIDRINLPHLWVERKLDTQIMQHNDTGAYNGHIPISAIFAATGTIVALLSGNRDVVVSNENSANDPTLFYQGVAINHQYSKSLEFEIDFQKYLQNRLGDGVRYYSLLRPFSELSIAEMFSKYFYKYKDVFSSCNRAFTQKADGLFWCGQCAKCAFTFLILTPFISRQDLESLWGHNLLLDAGLKRIYEQLLGIQGDKPLDCVGEIRESRAAMRLAQEVYPELRKYHFDLPLDYDWHEIKQDSMPVEIRTVLMRQIAI